ncbi:Zn(II)2Cys6 transcription factor [Aspergillus saccharolyticus JOP 1030-1]|uniref:Zn(2)-C6 fungal-type domain-containing protein n=1 Tax=Aspergillus saccharolyticus JOP 1030-1 TaxID=1450539 RepID=A0A318ZDY0_9EURO|nr:hypothetical protein BP01DRAFT_398551 [Aspergillus saccharolyticus JOP 1030-1]PYH45579.1 hypothetical protein BP01DRAFT_398551 [Aspergillus saccharolyticus JOP 1030-1]
MPSESTLQVLQRSGYRLRRTHEKSRNGCLRCKQQRKKCDEFRPGCSRCTKRSYRCRYPFPLRDGHLSEEPESAHSPVSDRHVISGPESPVSGSHCRSRLSDPTPYIDEPITSHSSSSPDEGYLPGPLDATELSLLGHYLTHTSQTIPFDELDRYALAVGVPNLAFKCPAVMSSLLALAAACQSHDLAKQAPTPLDQPSLVHIRGLLALAERHHRASLRHIQAAMQNQDFYDQVLANAALMQRGQRLPTELLPQHSQWISFTRAAHTASTAVLNDIRLFLPIVASTYRQALERLRRRAETTVAPLRPSDCAAGAGAGIRAQCQASLQTVSILEQCATAALTSKANGGTVESPRSPALALHRCARVSPWVAQYMVSVTSMGAPQILRRIIMSILNQAPSEYLGLVQSVLDALAADGIGQDAAVAEAGLLSAPYVLAMDIFAHWLVLVKLLDGVWWLGEIGQWEIGQVLSVMKTRNPRGRLAEMGETWWPESMYLVKRELRPSDR